jgi:hypothetical protein
MPTTLDNISSTTELGPVPIGRYTATIAGTAWNGGSVVFERLTPDGRAWAPVQTFTADAKIDYETVPLTAMLHRLRFVYAPVATGSDVETVLNDAVRLVDRVGAYGAVAADPVARGYAAELSAQTVAAATAVREGRSDVVAASTKAALEAGASVQVDQISTDYVKAGVDAVIALAALKAPTGVTFSLVR